MRGRRGASPPGLVDGRHYSAYVEEFRQLKRNGRFDDAEALLLRFVDATEAQAKAKGWGVASSYYEELAIIYRKQKQLADEIEILERYERQAKVPGPLPARLAKRLAGLRAKAGKSP